VSKLIRTPDKHCVRQKVRFFLIGIIMVFPYLNLSGQSISGLRKLWQNDGFTFLSGSKKEKLFSTADFSEYAGTRDDEFADYLKEPWNDYSILAGIEDEPQLQVEQPIFDESNLDMNPPVNLAYSNVISCGDYGKGQIRMIPRIRKSESDIYNSLKVVFRFYGQQVNINYDKLLIFSKIGSFSEDSVSGFWKSFARSNSNQLVDQLMDYRDLLGLGDWGYFQLVKATSNHIFAGNVLNADLLAWALMIRSGFDVRLAFNQNSTTILFPCENTIYAKQFVVIGQKRFYLDREMKSQLLVTSQHPFPDNVGMIDLNFYKSVNFIGKLTIRKYSLLWNDRNYLFSMRYNPDLIRFYHDYPQTDPTVYFGAPVSSVLKEDLMGQLYPMLSKMDRPKAAAFLQQFVEKEFSFIPGKQTGGFSQSRFTEEMIASKSGDDRSKAVLFSWLVRVLLRLPVVGVQFPGYYSTAVCYDTPLDGNYYYLNRGKYYITDPSFINAPIGMTMPVFEGLTPQLIDLSSSYSQPNSASKIWELANKLGAQRGGANQDVVFDRRGRAFITGYFKDKRSAVPFVACFSKGNSLQWIRKFEADGKSIAFAITKTSDDEIYIAGSFHGKIVMNEKELQSGSDKPDLFIAQFSQNGELMWMNKIGMNANTGDEPLTYSVKFDRSGENINTQWSNEDERNICNGFTKADETGLSFVGSRSFATDIGPFSSTDSKFGVLNENSLSDEKISHSKVAGVLAVMKLLRRSGSELTGNQLQALLISHYPTFKVNNASLFNAIGQVELLKNENGIVLIQTIASKPILYNNLKLEDGARFNVSVFDNGDLSVGIISGFQKVVMQVPLTLNNILIDSSSGNVILDFDHDHTLKTVSNATILSAK